MISVIQVTCPSCGATIGPDNIHGTMVYCPNCKSYRVVANNRDTLRPVFNKIQRHTNNIYDYKRKIVNLIWDAGGKGVFDIIKPTSEFKRFYLPVREIYRGKKKTTLCLNEYNNILHNSPLNGEISSDITNTLNESDFSDLLSTDFNPIFIRREEDKIEFLSTDTPMDKIDAQYDVKAADMTVIKYLPITTVDTTMGRLFAIGASQLHLINPDGIKDFMKKMKLAKENEVGLKNHVFNLVVLGIIIALCCGVYRFLTMGISLSEFIWGVVYGIVYGIAGIFFIFFLMIITSAISMIVGPPIHTMRVIVKYWKESLKGDGDDLDKGYKVFGIK